MSIRLVGFGHVTLFPDIFSLNMNWSSVAVNYSLVSPVPTVFPLCTLLSKLHTHTKINPKYSGLVPPSIQQLW
jgi:hypothetical protein